VANKPTGQQSEPLLSAMIVLTCGTTAALMDNIGATAVRLTRQGGGIGVGKVVRAGKLVGIITRADLIRLLAKRK